MPRSFFLWKEVKTNSFNPNDTNKMKTRISASSPSPRRPWTLVLSATAKNILSLSGRLAWKALSALALTLALSASRLAADTWSAGADFPAVAVVRAVGNYFPANGRFYSMGGRSADSPGNSFTHPFEYNPATNTWITKAATYPDNRVGGMVCAVLTVSGTPQIYCVGGNEFFGDSTTARVFSYNPVTDTITTLTTADNWPGNTTGTIVPGGFAVAGNKLYIIGGFDISIPAGTAQTWQFDPNAAVGSRWLQRLDYPVGRGYVPAATIGGLIYTGGGFVGFTDSADSFKYDPVANTWTAITNIPRATSQTRAVVINSEMWVLGGGQTSPNPSNEVDIYNPCSNTWRLGPPFVTARRFFPADSDGSSRVWLAGGFGTGGLLLNTMEIYGPGMCPSPTPTPSPTATATATPTATSTPVASPTPAPTPTPSPTPPSQAINLSTRMRVQTGDNVGIGGFIITGSAPKHVVLRAIGPSLTQFGVPDALADPVLELHGPGTFVTIMNDNWRDDPAQAALLQADGLAPSNDLESAIDATLAPGAYTGIVRGKNNSSGVGLIEVYDLNPSAASKLGNISTRAFVSTGDNIVIAGFILGHNSGVDRIVARGIGPSLTAFGVPNALADPTLELRDGNGALLIANNNWQDDPVQAAELTAAGLAPTNPLESGIAATLPPGLYTALLAGLNNGTGVGLVEVYDLGAP
jgi:hypothetical protein